MAEAILAGVLAGGALYHLWVERCHTQERQAWTEERLSLIHRIMARTPMEAKALDEPFIYKKIERELPDGFEAQVGM